jgi:hypothetical protein
MLPLARWYARRLKTANPATQELQEAPEVEELNKRRAVFAYVLSLPNDSDHG